MKKLLEVQNQLITFKKDGTNPHFKSKYLTLDNLLEKLLPICNVWDRRWGSVWIWWKIAPVYQ